MLPIKIQLPKGFLDDEIRCGYKVTHEMKEIWAVELDLLAEFQRVCDKYKLKWFTGYGTTLGAIRHKGMIPWDDDIDVLIFRKDYNRLIEIAKNEFCHPYFFQTEQTDPGSLRGHAQLRNSLTTAIIQAEMPYRFKFNQGQFLDIFILDNIPDDEEILENDIEEILEFRRRAYNKREEIEINTKHFRKNILKFIVDNIKKSIFRNKLLFPNGYNTNYYLYEKKAANLANDSSYKIANLGLQPIKLYSIWKRDDFLSSIMVDFEFLKVPVPVGYEEILTATYGDWHKYIIGTSVHKDVITDMHLPYTEWFCKHQ